MSEVLELLEMIDNAGKGPEFSRAVTRDRLKTGVPHCAAYTLDELRRVGDAVMPPRWRDLVGGLVDDGEPF